MLNISRTTARFFGMLVAFIAVLGIAISLVTTAPAAYADSGVDCSRGDCTVTPPEIPGGGGGGTTTTPSGNGGFTPGPTECFRKGEPQSEDSKIPCSDKGGYYQPDRGCYAMLQDPQNPPPPGQSAGDGAWYVCVPPDCRQNPDYPTVCTWSDSPRWLTSPPPGLQTYTPGQAAAQLVKNFKLQGASIGSTFAKSGKGAVGLPVWLWVDNQTPLSWGPYTESATLGGVTVTATARVANVAWSMGDGGTKVCANAGTPYVSGYGNADSPTCGYRYQKMSPSDGAQPYTVTATSNWEVTWSAAGQSGVIGTQTSSSTQVRIGELQAINVNP